MCMPLMLSRSRTLSRRTGVAVAAGTPSAAFSATDLCVSDGPAREPYTAEYAFITEGPCIVTRGHNVHTFGLRLRKGALLTRRRRRRKTCTLSTAFGLILGHRLTGV